MLRIINSSFKTKSKVIIGVSSTVRYIQLLFILKMIQAVFSTSICFIPDDSCNTCFVYEVQKTMINYLHELLPQVKKLFYFSDGCGGQYKNYKNFMNLCLHKQDFGLDAEWIFFATSHGKSPCDGIGSSVKHHAAQRSFPRPMNNQILDYQAMLNVCEEEMSKIKFFGISKETMDEVRKSLEERFSRGNTVPGTRSSHHFIPLSSKIAQKLASEDESHFGTHDFNLPTTFQLCNIRPMTYVTCLYD